MKLMVFFFFGQDKGGVSLESQDDGRTHFVEPLPGRVPSESHKIRKTSTDKQQENNFFDESKLEVLQLPKVSPVPTFTKKRNSDQGDLKTESKKGKTPGQYKLTSYGANGSYPQFIYDPIHISFHR